MLLLGTGKFCRSSQSQLSIECRQHIRYWKLKHASAFNRHITMLAMTQPCRAAMGKSDLHKIAGHRVYLMSNGALAHQDKRALAGPFLLEQCAAGICAFHLRAKTALGVLQEDSELLLAPKQWQKASRTPSYAALCKFGPELVCRLDAAGCTRACPRCPRAVWKSVALPPLQRPTCSSQGKLVSRQEVAKHDSCLSYHSIQQVSLIRLPLGNIIVLHLQSREAKQLICCKCSQ